MMPRTLGRVCTMGYYSDFDIDITIEGISKGEVEDIVERTFGEWIAGQLEFTDTSSGVFIVGTIDDTKWYGFTENVEVLRKAVAEAGGKFFCSSISRQGEDAGDGERFVTEGDTLVRQVTQLTWVTAED